MVVLVTGSGGHLGEALMRTLPQNGHEPRGLDLKESPFTQIVGSIVDRSLVRSAMRGVDAVIHTATLHKPHVVTHSRQDFIDTNVTGTLNLLDEARSAGVRAFIFTSTTSVFGRALTPSSGSHESCKPWLIRVSRPWLGAPRRTCQRRVKWGMAANGRPSYPACAVPEQGSTYNSLRVWRRHQTDLCIKVQQPQAREKLDPTAPLWHLRRLHMGRDWAKLEWKVWLHLKGHARGSIFRKN